MNNTFPERTRPYLAVFVVDLSVEFRAFNNLLIDCQVEYEQDEAALIEYALRRVFNYWNIRFKKPQPSALFVTEKTLGRVAHYAEHALRQKLNTLRQILEWAPSREIDDILIEEGVLYFCYDHGDR